MLTVKEMYEYTDELKVDKRDDLRRCDECEKQVIETAVDYSCGENWFCNYECFDLWATNEFASQADYLLDQWKESKR